MKRIFLIITIISCLLFTSSCFKFNKGGKLVNGTLQVAKPYITANQPKNYVALYDLICNQKLVDKYYEPTFLPMKKITGQSFDIIKDYSQNGYKMYCGDLEKNYQIYDGLCYQYASCNENINPTGTLHEYEVNDLKVKFYDQIITIDEGYVLKLEATFVIDNNRYYYAIEVVNKHIQIQSDTIDFINEHTDLKFDLAVEAKQIKDVNLTKIDDYNSSFAIGEFTCYVGNFKMNNLDKSTFSNTYSEKQYFKQITSTSANENIAGINTSYSFDEARSYLENNYFTYLGKVKDLRMFIKDGIMITLTIDEQIIKQIDLRILG